MPTKRSSISQFLSHGTHRVERFRSTEDCQRFTVWVDRAQTHGPLVNAFLAGDVKSAVLGLSPTSSSVNLVRLEPILDWTLALTSELTIIEGSWFHRWDRVVFDLLELPDAEQVSLRNMRRLHGRIRRIAERQGLSDKLRLLVWPDTEKLPDMDATAQAVISAMEKSPDFRSAMEAVVGDYLAHVRPSHPRALSSDDEARLLNYVRDEVAAFVYLFQHVSPVEVYPGADLPLMRRIARGEFADVLPFDLSQRTHVSIQLIPTPAGTIRAGMPADWPEIERLVRAWPTHFVAEAVPLVRADFDASSTTLCDDGTGRVLGFMIWKTDGAEMELLWMAVDPAFARKGVCRSVVMAVLCERRSESRVFLRTATLDSVIPNSGFSGAAYQSTYHFFESLGFRLGRRHEGYWGASNHMIEIERIYGC